MAFGALMVGAGEYTTGYVRTPDGEAASDKPAGVIAITLFDLRRLGKLDRLVLCDRDGTRMPAVRKLLRRKIGEVYADMDVTLETFPEDTVAAQDTAYLSAMDTMRRGDVVTIFTPDDTHFDIAMAAVQRGLHVLLAKPAVKTMEKHRMLIEAARKHQVLVAVEFHKRWDPIYADAHDRIPSFGPFSFFSSTMTQPKKQLHTFAAWAGRSSDISFYLNSHHIDFLCWSVGARAKPLRVTAAASTGVADAVLKGVREELEPSTATKGKTVEDIITLLVHWETKEGTSATSVHMASWTTPPADCHTQQHWHYMGHNGEMRADQSHRGYTGATDSHGFATLNPLYMKYTPDSSRHFSGQMGYGYRSISTFVEAAQQLNSGLVNAQDISAKGILATIDSLPALYTTAILEAGRQSLDAGGMTCSVHIP